MMTKREIEMLDTPMCRVSDQRLKRIETLLRSKDVRQRKRGLRLYGQLSPLNTLALHHIASVAWMAQAFGIPTALLVDQKQNKKGHLPHVRH
jgi:hypothetical protein